MGKILFKKSNGLISVYSDSAPSETTVKRWYVAFKRGRTDTNDAEHSGHPNSGVVSENTKILHKIVLADRNLENAWDNRGVEDIRR